MRTGWRPRALPFPIGADRAPHGGFMADTIEAPTTTASPTASSSNGKTGLADAFRTHFSGDGPIVDKAKSFAKDRPWATGALLGVTAIALLNTLRGVRG